MTVLPTFSPTDFVALVNQTLEYTYPQVVITGELANFKVSKNKWVYFDLKDEYSSVRFFGTIYQLPGPLEDGMVLTVTASPRLHPRFGFSCNVQSIQLTGEGTIKKAFDLLKARLEGEGLFAPERKRAVPYPPSRIGLITSGESAAYADFVKILAARWGGMYIELADVQVQGEVAPSQLVAAIDWFNAQAELPDVLVIIRGGGSADDLQAFSTEQVTRAVAASRIPTVVAIGHEIDESLAELAADLHASTPSNAAELLVPDRREELSRLENTKLQLSSGIQDVFTSAFDDLATSQERLDDAVRKILDDQQEYIRKNGRMLEALSPQAALKRGYAMVRKSSKLVRSAKELTKNDGVELIFHDGVRQAKVE